MEVAIAHAPKAGMGKVVSSPTNPQQLRAQALAGRLLGLAKVEIMVK